MLQNSSIALKCRRPEVEAQFRQLELPTSEAEELFDILDEDKTGELDIKTFVEGTCTSFACFR